MADQLLEEGAEVHVYDPMVSESRIREDIRMWNEYNGNDPNEKLARIVVHNTPEEATRDAFGAAILTEWDAFASYDWENLTKYDSPG